MKRMLNPGGKIVIDVGNTHMFKNKQESVTIENQLMQGFWSEGDYVGIHTSHIYSRDLVSLDHFFIIEPTENWQIFNWFQYYTPESIEVELRQSGFRVEQMVGDLTGIPLDQKGSLIGVIATADWQATWGSLWAPMLRACVFVASWTSIILWEVKLI